MDKSFLHKNKVIHYRLTGHGPVVMLVHGFGENAQVWKEMVEQLEKKYLLLIPDLPGSGASAALEGKPGLEDYAAVLQAIVEAENINRITLIGHSMGGYIALAYAEKHPDILQGLGLFHSSAYADDAAKKIIRKKAIEFIKTNGGPAFLKTSLPGLFHDTVKHQKEIEWLLQQGKKVDGNVWVQYYEAMLARPDRTHLLSELKIPFLFIMGVHDKAVPFIQSLEQCQLSAISYVYILRNSAHMGMLEEKEKSLSNILAFLNDNTEARS